MAFQQKNRSQECISPGIHQRVSDPLNHKEADIGQILYLLQSVLTPLGVNRLSTVDWENKAVALGAAKLISLLIQ